MTHGIMSNNPRYVQWERRFNQAQKQNTEKDQRIINKTVEVVLRYVNKYEKRGVSMMEIR